MEKLFIAAFIIAAFVLTGIAQEQSPAERRAREMVEMINKGDLAAYEDYVTKNFGGDFAQIRMEAHLDFFSSVSQTTQGFEITGIIEQQPNRIILGVRSKLTGEPDGLIVAVEDKAPYLITGLGTRAPAPSPRGPRLTDKEIAAEMDGLLKKLSDADVFSGTVLLAKDGKPVYKGAFGIANKDFDVPNRIDTKFNLGSMNKTFTAMSIAKLIEEGKVSLEDPLSKFLQDFPDEESARKIRIKHLLTHTAGLGGYFSEKWRMRARGTVRTVDDMIALAKEDERLRYEPGTNWQYSNTGMLVLGKVIEIASGKSYFDFVRDNILAPNGMNDTGCFELDKVNKNLAVGYHKEFTKEGVEVMNNIFEHVMRGGPQGGCYSTVEDLLKFSKALTGNKIVGEDLTRLFTTPKPDLYSPRYGFGFQANEEEGSFGHGGGFLGISADFVVFRNSGWTAIVLSNYDRGAEPVRNKMRRIILSQSAQ